MPDTTGTTTQDFTAVLDLSANPSAVSALFTSADGRQPVVGPHRGRRGRGWHAGHQLRRLRCQRDASP